MGVYSAILVVTLQIAVCYCIINNSVIPNHSLSTIVYEKQLAQCCTVILREGEDVCSLLKKYISAWKKRNSVCSNVTLEQIQTELLQSLLAHPVALSKIMMGENLFVSCAMQCSCVCENQLYRNVWKMNRERYLESLTEILEDTDVTDEVAVHKFMLAYEKDAIKLTSLEHLRLFSRAYSLKPNCSLFVNRFGHSLQLVEREDIKSTLYDIGVQRGLWTNKMQRPELSYISGLTAKPWHEASNFSFVKVLEEHYSTFREELEQLMQTNTASFGNENGNLNSFSGSDWTALVIKSDEGYSNISAYLPQTTKILQDVNENFILIKYSALKPGTHIVPHTGPSNDRLRAHFCIFHTGGARMRVGEEWKTWEEGKVIVLDSSFEHEVVHAGLDLRIVLILDIWHPEYQGN